jgi:hypothetical protein
VSIFPDALPSVQTGERSSSDSGPAAAPFSQAPVLFARYEKFSAVKMPQAARRIYDILHDAARRYGPEIKLKIAEIIDALPPSLRVKRRCITKGLRQLELMGIIFRDKCRAGGVRIINFLREFVSASNRTKPPQSGSTAPADEAPLRPTPESLEPSEPLPRGGAEFAAFFESIFHFKPGTTGASEAAGLKPAMKKAGPPPASHTDQAPPPEAPRPADE